MNDGMYKNTTIVIVGNGFDKSHNLKTGYGDFVSYMEKNSPSDFEYLKEFMSFKETYYHSSYDVNVGGVFADGKGANWSDFERVIGSITNHMSQDEITGREYDYQCLHKDIAALNQTYNKLGELFMTYLGTVTKGKINQSIIKPQMKEYLMENTPVINFNYTRTPELYSQNVFYIHGSLKENNIVFGYDGRAVNDVEDPEFSLWDKRYRRDELGLKRYVSQECIGLSEKEYLKLLDEFRCYCVALENQGIDITLKKELRYYNLIREYEKGTTLFGYGFKFDLSKIKRIVFIGHSLSADEMVLREIMSKCEKLERLVLFQRKNEDERIKEKRKNFLHEYCNAVESVIFIE